MPISGSNYTLPTNSFAQPVNGQRFDATAGAATLDDIATALDALVDGSGQAASSITNAKLANMAQATIKGRASGAGTGAPQDVSHASLATDLADTDALSFRRVASAPFVKKRFSEKAGDIVSILECGVNTDFSADSHSEIQSMIDYYSDNTPFPRASTAIYIPSHLRLRISEPLILRPYVSLYLAAGSAIQARAEMEAMLKTETTLERRASKQSIMGGGVWDCNDLADTSIYLYGFAKFMLRDHFAINYKKWGIRLGNTTFNSFDLDWQGGQFEHILTRDVTEGADEDNPGSAVVRSDTVSDSHISDVFGMGGEYGFWGRYFGVTFTNCHPWTYAGQNMRAAFHNRGEGCRYIGCDADLGHADNDSKTSYAYRFQSTGTDTTHHIVGSSNQYNGGGNASGTDSIISADSGITVVAEANKFQGSSSVKMARTFTGAGSIRAHNNTETNIINPIGDNIDECNNEIPDPYFDYWPDGTSRTTDGYLNLVAMYIGSGAAATLSRQTFTTGQTDVPDGPKYYLRLDRTTAGSSSTVLQFIVPDVTRFAGKTVWLQAYARGSKALSVVVRCRAIWDGSTNETSAGETRVLSTSFDRVAIPLVCPSASGKTVGTGSLFIAEVVFPSSEGVASFDLARMELVIAQAPKRAARPTFDEVVRRCSYFLRKIRMPVYSSSAGLNSALAGVMYRTPTITVVPDSGTGATFIAYRETGTNEITLVQDATNSVDNLATVLLDARP